MKKYLKFLLIIFFITNSPNYLYANIDNIFGIKIFDDVSKYAKIENMDVFYSYLVSVILVALVILSAIIT